MPSLARTSYPPRLTAETWRFRNRPASASHRESREYSRATGLGGAHRADGRMPPLRKPGVTAWHILWVTVFCRRNSGNALAFDELHDQVGQAVLRHSTVDKPRDMRMIDRGEQVLFRLKAAQDVVVNHLALEQLEREAVRHIAEPLRFGVVESGGPVNFAGGTLPDESLKLVTIDSPSGGAPPLASPRAKSPATTLCGLAGHGVFMNPSHSAIAFAASNFSISAQAAVAACSFDRGIHHDLPAGAYRLRKKGSLSAPIGARSSVGFPTANGAALRCYPH